MSDTPSGEGTEGGFDALVRTAVSASTDLGAALNTITRMGRSAIGGCRTASVTLIEAGEPSTVGAADEVASALDQLQYAAGTGPCLEAVAANATIRIDSLAGTDRWADFATAAQELGVRSSLSLPLPLPEDTAGGLNLYGKEENAFGEADEKLGALFASYAATVVANVTAYKSASELAEHLQRAMESRATIEQAKGILMARQRTSADEAFDILRRASQRENRKLRDIAAEVVRRTQEGV